MKRTGRQAAAALLALGIILACAGAPVSISTQPPAFSTATPGGSISIWLGTGTPGAGESSAQALTPIGPVATATAAAMTAIAETATAVAPTPTIPGLFSGPAQCPPPAAPSLPAQPPVFSRYAEIIVRYLSAGGAPTVLEATLRNWDAIGERGGLVRADRDLTGDGVAEVFMVLLDPENPTRNPQPGDLFVFGCQEGAYRLLYQAGYLPDRGAPVLVSGDDINGDKLNDLVYVVRTCGQESCSGEVSIQSWNVTLGNFGSLLAGSIVAQEAEVSVEDPENDGRADVIVTQGVIADPDAGPQREVTTTYRWNGVSFVPALVEKSALQYRIHAIHDGDDALAGGDARAAIDAYKLAAENSTLLAWVYPNETQYLTAFARYRLLLAYVASNNLSRAQAEHDRLVGQFFPPPPTPVPEGFPTPVPTPFAGPLPGLEYANMASLFWQNFSVNRDLARACEGVISYATANPVVLDPLNSFGYANRSYTPESMCPLGR